MNSLGGDFIFKASSLSLGALFFALVGILVWWIIRRRLRDFSLPIIRVFSLPVSRLPRIIFQKPPLVPFLVFSLSGLAFVIWSFRPSQKVIIDAEPGLRRVHVFIDMSPSVSAVMSIGDLGKQVVNLLERVSSKSRVSFGTSHGDNIYELTTPVAAGEILAGLGFHRGGVKIGSGVRSQISRIGHVDQLFVVSDRDQHSWSGFQWQYLTVDAEVHHLDVDDPGRRAAKPNVFIQDVRYLSGVSSPTMDWEVEVSLGVLSVPVTGTITASIAGESIGSANWEIQSGRRTAAVTMSWPAAKIPEEAVNQPIEWTIEVVGGDLMQMDNKFLSPVRGRRDRVAIVGEPSGELRLEDPLVHLETALRVSGYDVSRFDRWPSINQPAGQDFLKTAGVVVLMSGDVSSTDLWCPSSLSGPEVTEKSGPIWLTPRSMQESFSPLCGCLAKFGLGVTNDMCSQSLSRNDWIALLRAVGAKQVGGEIGSLSQSVAMKLTAPKAPRDVLLFTVPVRPNAEIGLSWGTFPIMVKDLMLFSTGRLIEGGPESAVVGAWPRIADISKMPAQGEIGGNSVTQVFRNTNVPVGESVLAVLPKSDLPSSWSSSVAMASGSERAGREGEDASVWVRILAAVISVLLAIELFWLWRRSKIKSSVVAVLISLLSMAVPELTPAKAQARMVLLSSQAQNNISFSVLSREVASRTSIELATSPEIFLSFDDAAAAMPWIWTTSPTKLASKSGQILDSARLWLKKGGILIIDGAQPAGTLEKLLEPLMVGTVKPTGWMALPPDHEFMRSFYLLNSLPTCKGRSWRVFSFDGRVAAIESPYSNLNLLQDRASAWNCESKVSYEQHVRIFVNLMMMAFTTDYKRDQIHLPEILKRLRVP